MRSLYETILTKTGVSVIPKEAVKSIVDLIVKHFGSRKYYYSDDNGWLTFEFYDKPSKSSARKSWDDFFKDAEKIKGVKLYKDDGDSHIDVQNTDFFFEAGWQFERGSASDISGAVWFSVPDHSIQESGELVKLAKSLFKEKFPKANMKTQGHK